MSAVLPAPQHAARHRVRSRVLACTLACIALVLVGAVGSGFGATQVSSTVLVNAAVNDTITITDPTAFDPSPAPSAGATWTSGSPDQLSLGVLHASQVGSAAATWKVSTTAANGYTLQLASTQPGQPLLRSGANLFPDMCMPGGAGCPGTLSLATSHFGVAIGDSAAHTQGAVAPLWGTSGGGGTQGKLYAGVPTAGVVIATRPTNASNDPVTIHFAAVSAASTQPPAGTYAGTIRLTATTL